MRIKLYEEYSFLNNDLDDYYEEIKPDEWEKFIPIMMTKSTIEKIRKIIPTEPLEYYNKHGKFIRLRYEKKTEIKQKVLKNFNWSWTKKYEIKTVSIYEDDDEYFYVNYCKMIDEDNVSIIETYKCDQFEGLVKLLKNLNI